MQLVVDISTLLVGGIAHLYGWFYHHINGGKFHPYSSCMVEIPTLQQGGSLPPLSEGGKFRKQGGKNGPPILVEFSTDIFYSVGALNAGIHSYYNKIIIISIYIQS